MELAGLSARSAPTQIANRIKAKGLQKLRWYCQMCGKQCRDENGFKCHLSSESHQRQMMVFGQVTLLLGWASMMGSAPAVLLAAWRRYVVAPPTACVSCAREAASLASLPAESGARRGGLHGGVRGELPGAPAPEPPVQPCRRQSGVQRLHCQQVRPRLSTYPSGVPAWRHDCFRAWRCGKCTVSHHRHPLYISTMRRLITMHLRT